MDEYFSEQDLIQQREEARKDRDFVMADEIRDDLIARDIYIDDRRRQWSVGRPAPSGRASAFGDRGGRDASMGAASFTRRGGGDLSAEDEQTIVQLLEERNDCKRNKQFGKADRIRDRLGAWKEAGSRRHVGSLLAGIVGDNSAARDPTAFDETHER